MATPCDNPGNIPRLPTFLVNTAQQKITLEKFQRREERLSTEYDKSRPLCFNAGAHQRTHPAKVAKGSTDADVTLRAPMILGVADGVSQVEEFGIDPSVLPRELLRACELLAMQMLNPFVPVPDGIEKYDGPMRLLADAYTSTTSFGSTTALVTVLDNSTHIHGRLQPKIAVLSIGDCQLLILRRPDRAGKEPMEAVFNTEMQRIGGHAQTPMQVCRLDKRMDSEFSERATLDVIETGSAVHCVSAARGDIVVLGSDGVFDNLFINEIVDFCNLMLPPQELDNGQDFVPRSPALLATIARRIVAKCHMKTRRGTDGTVRDSPIGKGGKADDTSVVVGEVVEWTEAHRDACQRMYGDRQWEDLVTCGGGCDKYFDDSDCDEQRYSQAREYAGAQEFDGNVVNEPCCVVS